MRIQAESVNQEHIQLESLEVKGWKCEVISDQKGWGLGKSGKRKARRLEGEGSWKNKSWNSGVRRLEDQEAQVRGQKSRGHGTKF